MSFIRDTNILSLSVSRLFVSFSDQNYLFDIETIDLDGSSRTKVLCGSVKSFFIQS